MFFYGRGSCAEAAGGSLCIFWEGDGSLGVGERLPAILSRSCEGFASCSIEVMVFGVIALR